MVSRPSRTKTRDAIALMVVLGTWLVMPPMLTVVNQPAHVFGIPIIVVYVFLVWAVLILLTRVLAGHSTAPPPGDGGSGEEGR